MVAAAEKTEQQQIAKKEIEFRKIDGEYIYAGKRAGAIAQITGAAVGENKFKEQEIRFSPQEYKEAKGKLEEMGFQVSWEKRTHDVPIAADGSATFMGEVAHELQEAGFTSVTVGDNESGKAKAIIPADRVKDAVDFLKDDKGYKFKTYDGRPRADINLFAGGANLFGKPAEIAAAALGMEVGQTRGEKPKAHLKLTNDQIPAAKEALEAAGFKPKDVQSDRQSDTTKAYINKQAEGGAKVYGKAAQVLAEAWFVENLETTTKGTPFITVPEEEIAEAQATLEAEGFTVEVKEPQQRNENLASISTLDNGNAFIFGDAGKEAARKFAELAGSPAHMRTTRNQNLMVEITAAHYPAVKAHLIEKGFEIEEKALSQMVKENPQAAQQAVQEAQSKKPAPAKKKLAEGLEF